MTVPVGVGDLDAAEVVLVLHALGVHGVPAVAIAVPGVDRDARRTGRCPRPCPGWSARTSSGTPSAVVVEVPKTGADVAADDAGLLEHVRSVGSVAGVGTGGLVGDLRHARRSRSPTRRRSTWPRLHRRRGRTSRPRARTPSASGGGTAAYGRRSRVPDRRPLRPGGAGDGPGTRVRGAWGRAEAGSRGGHLSGWLFC